MTEKGCQKKKGKVGKGKLRNKNRKERSQHTSFKAVEGEKNRGRADGGPQKMNKSIPWAVTTILLNI